ncbi:MAG: DNA polymerase III subunit gamma/tau [Gemmataceae bacterium]
MAKSKTTSSLIREDAAASGSYTVMARRHRPQQFGELVGQEAVAQALMNAIKNGRVAHAYLFTGARGVGKTSTARILAKALNCVKGPTPNPCNECDICKSITSGEDVDVLEIDGASNRGIENVREIRNNVQYRPSRSRYKIYIIDEVHMLSREAFNALLKTLEEPPEHVKFIFATTEVQKIPITILSRCQRFDFGTITTSRIVQRLRGIVGQEGLQADDEALEMVARRAAGSMRDAQSLLDQLLAFSGDRLTADRVHQLLGTADEERVVDLAGAILAHDPKTALDFLAKTAEQGLALGELLDQLIAYWRDLMLVHCAGQEAKDLSISPRFRQAIAKQAKELNLDTILAGLDVLSASKARLRFSNHGRIILEMAVIRLSRLEDLASLTQLAQMVAQNSALPRRNASPAQKTSNSNTAPPEGVKKKLSGIVEESIAASGSAELITSVEVKALTPETLTQVWREVLTLVGPLLASQLKNCPLPAISGPNTLVISVPNGYTHLSDGRQNLGRLGRIEEALRKLTGHSYQLRVETTSTRETTESLEASRAEGLHAPRRVDRRAEASQEPLLKYAMEALEAQVLQIDEGFGSVAASNAAEPDPETALETED